MQGRRAEEGEAVDVAKVHLAREEEEGAEEEEEEDGAGHVGVVHEVVVDVLEGVQHCEGLQWLVSHSCLCRFWAQETHLCANMSEIHSQLLQQRRLLIIPFRRKRRQPSRPQPALLAHPASHAARSAKARRGREARWLCTAERAADIAAVGAVRGLLGGRCAGDAVGVGGWVELEVLRGGGGGGGCCGVGRGGGGVVEV